MTQHDTERGLVRTVETTAERPSLARVELQPAFISQLIAEHDRLPPQRLRRRATVGTAIAAYDQGERRDARRLPQGFFRSAEA